MGRHREAEAELAEIEARKHQEEQALVLQKQLLLEQLELELEAQLELEQALRKEEHRREEREECVMLEALEGQVTEEEDEEEAAASLNSIALEHLETDEHAECAEVHELVEARSEQLEIAADVCETVPGSLEFHGNHGNYCEQRAARR